MGRTLTPAVVPTIAAINGHCFAGGFALALLCDYRIMTDGSQRNAWMCMNEVLSSSILPPYFPAFTLTRPPAGPFRRQLSSCVLRDLPYEDRRSRRATQDRARGPPLHAT